jgi:hypothetical protein
VTAAAAVDPQAMAALLERFAAGDRCACLDHAERVVAEQVEPLPAFEHFVVVYVIEVMLAAACVALLREACEPV